ncbi:hypothetical protein AgCh_037430 [Apium graveolens]
MPPLRLKSNKLEMQKQCTKDSEDIKEIQKQLGDVVMKMNQKRETSINSQANDILDVPMEESDLLYDDNEEVVAIEVKDKFLTLSYPVGIDSRFDYVPFPSRENVAHDDLNVMEEELEDVIFEDHDKDLLGNEFFGMEQSFVPFTSDVKEPAHTYILEFDLDEDFAFKGSSEVVNELALYPLLQDPQKLEWKPSPIHSRYHIPFYDRKPGSRVLYLGDVCGITVSQLSHLVGSDGLVYVRGLSDDVANKVEERSNVILPPSSEQLVMLESIGRGHAMATGAFGMVK